MEVCRICLGESELNNPLISRCNCKSGLVHDSCLEKWIKCKGNLCCEVCKSDYQKINVKYTFKDDKDTFKFLLPTYSGISVIFLSLIFFELKDCNSLNNKNENIEGFKMLYFLSLMEIFNSNQFKSSMMKIDKITFDI